MSYEQGSNLINGIENTVYFEIDTANVFNSQLIVKKIVELCKVPTLKKESNIWNH